MNTYPLGVGIPPERLYGGMAASIEAERTSQGDYPPEWPAVAWLVKTIAGWKCERCGHEHTPAPPWVLTVHHLDGVKANLQHWNLAALCQRCHLRIQNRVVFQRDWPFEHSPWMAVHVADYNEWALGQRCPSCGGSGDDGHAWDPIPVHAPDCDGWCHNCPVPEPRGPEPCQWCGGSGHPALLSFNGVAPRSYEGEWPEIPASRRREQEPVAPGELL